MTRCRLFALLLLSVSLISTGVAYAQEPTETVTDDDVNQVARELYCPICENTPLDVCETQACEDWRQLIREKLQAGQSDQQIIQYFADIYGERARATPSTTGFSRVVWIAPVVLTAILVAYFARLLKRWLALGTAQAGASVPAPTIPLDSPSSGEREVDDYVARLEQEVQDSA